MDDDVYIRCIEFISKALSIKKDKLTPETRILEDLGVDGADALEFIEEFAKEFDIDFSAFEFDKHFSSEGFNPFLSLWYLLFNRSKLRGIPITIKDLVIAARIKKWFKEEIGTVPLNDKSEKKK